MLIESIFKMFTISYVFLQYLTLSIQYLLVHNNLSMINVFYGFVEALKALCSRLGKDKADSLLNHETGWQVVV